MNDAEIAGYMGWRGPGAYTQHTMKKIRQIVSEVQRREKERCIKACEDIENDKWALYKGREPYKGNEDGRASDYVQGLSDGAGMCSQAIKGAFE